jgi:hypothetical protein
MVEKGAPSGTPAASLSLSYFLVPSRLLSAEDPHDEFLRSMKQFRQRDEILSSFADNISRECWSTLEEKHQRHAHQFGQRKERTYFR